MQLSAIYRRGVVVPLDDAAAKALEEGDVTEVTRVRLVEIADDTEFEALWETGIFEAVNDAAGSLVGDYEDEVIPSDKVPRVRELAQSYARRHAADDTTARFFAALVETCELAEQEERSIYFVL